MHFPLNRANTMKNIATRLNQSEDAKEISFPETVHESTSRIIESMKKKMTKNLNEHID